ncbi:MAG: fibronectin type III domain-containing protein [Candidatus Pacebacteria bacterium]|nr:fibronectin type III domain-containing protein [Candidatus Paceibacterota bacterium]
MHLFKKNKKAIPFFVVPIILALVLIGTAVYAGNSHSIDLESSSSQYLSRTDIASTTPGGDITMEAWFKLESLPGTSASYTVVTLDSADVSPYVAYMIKYVNDSGTKKLKFNRARSCVTNNYTDYTVNLNIEQWYHTALTYDGTYIRGYLDGSLVAGPTAQSGNGVSCGSQYTFIGALDSSGSTEHFDGLIDDVRIWTSVRTGAEINDNKSAEIDSASGLVASWHLDNDLLDSSGNNRTLTNNNSAVFSTDSGFDITAPVISSLQSSNITDTTSVITWTTNESADSKVNYGTVSGTLTSNASSTPLITSHSTSLTGLSANTTYYYEAVSTDEAGNTATSSEQSFTTLQGPLSFAHKSQDQATSSQATLFVDDDLSLTLDANTSYVITAAITASSTATQPDINMSFNAPPGASMALTFGSFDGTAKVAGSGLFSSNDTEVAIDLPATGLVVMQIDGVITTGATAGTVEFEWAQDTSNATEIKVFKGSYLRAEKIQ